MREKIFFLGIIFYIIILSVDYGLASTIEGVVKLPSINAKGDLYISFEQEPQENSSFLPGLETESSEFSRPMVIIKAEEIKSDLVAFKIENVKPGDYWGYATWDIAEPYCSYSNLAEIGCPGFAGDYVGGTKEQVVVPEDNDVKDVYIECKYRLVENKPTQP